MDMIKLFICSKDPWAFSYFKPIESRFPMMKFHVEEIADLDGREFEGDEIVLFHLKDKKDIHKIHNFDSKVKGLVVCFNWDTLDEAPKTADQSFLHNSFSCFRFY